MQTLMQQHVIAVKACGPYEVCPCRAALKYGTMLHVTDTKVCSAAEYDALQ